MKADITEDGVLRVWAEDRTEMFALRAFVTQHEIPDWLLVNGWLSPVAPENSGEWTYTALNPPVLTKRKP